MMPASGEACCDVDVVASGEAGGDLTVFPNVAGCGAMNSSSEAGCEVVTSSFNAVTSDVLNSIETDVDSSASDVACAIVASGEASFFRFEMVTSVLNAG